MKLTAKYDGLSYKTNDASFQYHINNGISEPYPDFIALVKKYLNMFPYKNRTYIDVGSHIGTTALPYSRLYDNVYAYEPNLEMYEFLTENVNINNVNNIKTKNIAISDEFCKINVRKHGSNSGCFYIEKKDDGEIDCITLDSENIENVDYIKIDTEGSELLVLKGSVETIKKYKPLIQVEINGLSDRLFNTKKDDILDFLFEMNYKIFETISNNVFLYCPNDTLNITNRNIFCFWTGNNKMSEDRSRCLDSLKITTECNIILVTPDNLEMYITEPLHPSYEYLSETHKADYLRTYFMHFYGGGYTDIKFQTGSWINAFIELEQSECYINGYPEKCEGDIGYLPNAKHYKYLIGNGAYIVRPNTDLTHSWYSNMIELLDNKLDELKKNPSTFPQDCKKAKTGYPIEWNEMLGRIFHRICYDWKEKILKTVPVPIFYNYR